MSFDGVVTRAIVHELQQTLLGGRISKIYQPQPRDLTLVIRAKRANHLLLLSAHASLPRIQLTQTKPNNPKEPPSFCMLMRKYCEGGIIHAIEQVEMERIVHIDILARNELGDPVVRRLVMEIMGRHSNLILINLEDSRILDSIVHVGYNVSQVRQVLPGLTYVSPPPQQKSNPLTVNETQFIAGFDYNGGRLDRQIVNRFTGIGPQLAKEIVHRAGLGQRTKLWKAFRATIEQIKQHQYQPTIVNTSTKKYFAAFPLTFLPGTATTFATMNECIDQFYTSKAKQDWIRQQTSDLYRLVQNELAKNKKKLTVLDKEFQKIKRADQMRIYGELLMASLYQVKRGDTELEVVNFYDPKSPIVKIPLDPVYTPIENAERYFKKYNKLKTAYKWNREQKEKTKKDIAYLESILVQLEQLTVAEIEQIREELAEAGILKQKQTKQKKKPIKPTPLQLYSSDQTPIWVGKNNKQNDYLTHRLASSYDTWLHTKEIPGSHVVIRSRSISEQTLREAAMLAAYFSKARESSQVPVDYTLVKHVKKPSGGRLGFVTYEKQQTIYVTPDPEKVEQLLASAQN